MTLKEANNFFKILNTITTNKSKNRVYENFVDVLSELKVRSFLEDEFHCIETKLEC